MEALQCPICPTCPEAHSPGVSVTDIILIVTTAANIFLTVFQIGVDYHYKTTRGKPYLPNPTKNGSASPRGKAEKFAASV